MKSMINTQKTIWLEFFYIFIKMKKKKNGVSGICLQRLQIAKQIWKTLTFTLRVFDIDCL